MSIVEGIPAMNLHNIKL